MRNMTPLPQNEVPFYKPLKGYEWVDAFLKVERWREEIKRVEAEISKIKNEPNDKTSLLERLRTEYQNRFDAQVTATAKLINDFRLAPHVNVVDRLCQLSRDRGSVFAPLPHWDLIESAVEILEDGLTDQQREKQIKMAEQERDKIRKKIADKSPERFFPLHRGSVVADIRAVFVEHWRGVQSGVNAPCDPLRRSLHKYSDDNEIAAWKKLVGPEYISDGITAPWNGTDF